ncbi:MAG: hypothetical protein WDM76_09545 [Limisphaerales bacterium]
MKYLKEPAFWIAGAVVVVVVVAVVKFSKGFLPASVTDKIGSYLA